jgi:glucan biosynthesis protein
MASWYATMLEKDTQGAYTESVGSFKNICIDGRLHKINAIGIAEETLSKERGYAGFKLEKLNRAWEYRNPIIRKK